MKWKNESLSLTRNKVTDPFTQNTQAHANGREKEEPVSCGEGEAERQRESGNWEVWWPKSPLQVV